MLLSLSAALASAEHAAERVSSALTATEPPRSSSTKEGYYPLIVIKGERHTGTNFITNVLENSFGSGIRVLGGASDPDPMISCNPFEREPPLTYCCWKHGYASTFCHGFQSPDLPALPAGAVASLPPHVFLVRSPYPWLLSMHDEPYDYDGDLTFNFYIVSFHLSSLDNTSLHFSTLLQRKSTLVSSIVSGSKAGQRSTQKSTADQQRPIRHPTVHASDPAYRSTTTLLALKLAMKISSPST